jgi:hypothetical protein
VLFGKRFWDGIAQGSVTATFGRWRRLQARARRRQRTAGGIVEVDAVDVVGLSDITDADARSAGYQSAAALVADLRGDPELLIYRVRFHRVAGPDPRAELAASGDLSSAEVAELDRRLRRLDEASPRGAWTSAALRTIAARPAVRAGDLAEALGWDMGSFKTDVRKLKNLGLTISLPVGYQLSPRGEAYLASASDDGVGQEAGVARAAVGRHDHEMEPGGRAGRQDQ